jgi:anti-sigma regulatory factor (Ser/Thr protein kinase)
MTCKDDCDYIEIEKKPGGLEGISDFIQERSLSVKLGFKKTWELMLVVDEICSNIISNSTSSDSMLKVTWRYDGNSVTVEVLDRGFPYNPLNPTKEDDEEESLGVMNTYMIEKMVDSAEYQRINETNRVSIIKCRHRANNKNNGVKQVKDKNKDNG